MAPPLLDIAEAAAPLLDIAEAAAEALLSRGVWAALGLSSVAFSLYSLVSSRVLPADSCHDCPRWSWIASLPFQIVLFPAVWLWAFASQDLPLTAWIVAGWDAPGGYEAFDLRRLWLVLFFGYVAKDCVMYECMTLIYWLHHAVCFAITISYLHLDPPTIFITGAMLCEVGSSTNSLFYVLDDSPTFGRFVWWLHAVIMTASNIASIALVVLLMQQLEHSLWSRLTFSLVTVILIEERQRNCHTNLREWKPLGAPKAAAAAAAAAATKKTTKTTKTKTTTTKKKTKKEA